MTTHIHHVLAVAIGSGVAAVAAIASEPAGYDRYQVIVEKSPFGAIVDGVGAEPLPNFAENYQFVGFVPSQDSGELLAVLFDTKNNRSGLVSAGETFGDVEVEEIDLSGEAPKVVIRKGLEPATLRMKPREEALATSAAAATASQAAKTAASGANQAVTTQQAGVGTTERKVIMPRRRRIPFRRGQ